MALKPIGFLLKLMSLAGICLAAGAVRAGTTSAHISSQSQAQQVPILNSSPKLEAVNADSKAASNAALKAPEKTTALPKKAKASAPAKKSPIQANAIQPEKLKAPTKAVSLPAKTGPANMNAINLAKTSTLAITQIPTESRLSGSSSSLATSIASNEQGSKLISGAVSLSYSQSLVDHQDGTVKNSRGALAILKGSLTDNWSLLGRLAAEEDLKDPESIDNGISDLLLVLNNKERPLTSWLTGAWSLATVLPTSERSQKVDQLKTTLGTGYKFGLAESVLPAGLSTILGLNVSKNFHQYETDTGGEVLNSYGLKETLNIDYTYKRWSLSLEFIHRNTWNYAGNVSQSFEHTEEIGFNIQPIWKVSLGHTNAGSWLKANTQDLNLSLYNENDSIVYGSTELTF